MNKVILVGNLTRDPELTETPTGIAVCRFSIAVTRDYANSEGTRETDFFNITVWRGRAENCGKYLKKGSKVLVEGQMLSGEREARVIYPNENDAIRVTEMLKRVSGEEWEIEKNNYIKSIDKNKYIW